MASELTVTARLRFRKGNIDTGDRGVSNLSRDVAGDSWSGGIIPIGTVPEIIINNPPGSAVARGGYVLLRNQDETYEIRIGTVVGSGFEAFSPLLPGDVVLMPIYQQQYWAEAIGGTALLEVILIEA